MADKCVNHNVEMEWHSRSRNLRFGNIKEKTNEDYKNVVCFVFKEFDLNQSNIENCHRVGEKEKERNRQMEGGVK